MWMAAAKLDNYDGTNSGRYGGLYLRRSNFVMEHIHGSCEARERACTHPVLPSPNIYETIASVLKDNDMRRKKLLYFVAWCFKRYLFSFFFTKNQPGTTREMIIEAHHLHNADNVTRVQRFAGLLPGFPRAGLVSHS